MVLAVCVPDVPVIVSVYWPMAAVLLALTVIVLLPVVGLGLKMSVTPLGRPETDRLTLPVKPYRDDTLIEPVLELPWPTVMPP